MAIEKGDLIKIEYTAYMKNSGQVVDTTDEKKAKDAGLYDQKKKYGAAIITVGAGQVLKGVDDALVGINENETKEIDVEPEKAFGARNEELVRIIPLKQFKQAGMNPTPGQIVNIDNTPATIKAVNSGRVVTDFNHPLAGIPLKYELKVLKDAKTLEEKARLLTEKYNMKCSVKVDGDTVAIDLGTEKYNQQRARDAAAVGALGNELKTAGAKKVQFKGEWEL